MTVKLSNNATSTLSVNINAAATSLTIQSADAGLFPHVVGDEWFPLTLYDATKREIVHVTKRVGGVLTVKRAQEGTNAYDWNVGTRVDLRLTKEVIEEIQQGSKDDYEALSADIAAIEDKLFPKTGGTITGDVAVNGNVHATGDVDVDGKLTANEIEANNANFENLTATNISTPNHIKVGTAKFKTDGNIEGDVWEEWGAQDAKTAIHNHIEEQVAEFAHNSEFHVIEMFQSGQIPWPDWVTDKTPVHVMAWGGGGGGGSNHSQDSTGGGGGGYMERWFRVGDFAGNNGVIIGGGGGVGWGSPGIGGTGGTTKVGNLISVEGGLGGRQSMSVYPAGGAGGGWGMFRGGNGGTRPNHNNIHGSGHGEFSYYGGGGGGGNDGYYGAGNGGVSVCGGGGGAGKSHGQIPGGGGGAHANGAQGKVILRILK